MEDSPTADIREFRPDDEDAFRRLNEAWVVKYFRLEAKDREVLSDPEGQIIARGGVIFMAEVNGQPVGCCALLSRDEETFEVAKMAVAEAYQGRGFGRLLLEACIAKSRALGKRRLFLETNSKLIPAVSLYRKLGFVELPLDQAPPSAYSRVDMIMELRCSIE